MFDTDGMNERSEMREIAAMASLRRRYQQRLLRHPDPRDPDYPGDLHDEDDERGDD